MRRALLAAVALTLTGCTAAGPSPEAPSLVDHRAVAPAPAGHSVAATRPAHAVRDGGAAPSAPRSIPVAGRSRAGTVARLVIPSRAIDAPVVPVRFAGAQLRIPPSVAEVGSWVDGAHLADAVGTTVLVGHVSDDHDHPGVLGRLRGVRVGAQVQVVPEHGTARRFVVTRVRSYAKDGLPRSVFAQTGPHRLVLITCTQRVTLPGGGFHYARNLVVTARPALRP